MRYAWRRLRATPALASWGSRCVAARVFGIMPNSITNWVVVPIVVLAAGVLAAYRPARRASRIDPNVASLLAPRTSHHRT